ncbi:MAG: GHKL domain-containing protein, partial [Ruminococcus sp.]|nr:GHKL domain-containing protein [Ruminococcus sp.]
MKVLTGIFLSLANVIMLINNLKIQTSLFQGKYSTSKRTNICFIALFSALCTITSYMALCDPIPFCYIFLFVFQYLSIALIPILVFRCNIKRIIYTAMFLIFSDSLLSSAVYVIIRISFKNPDKDLSHSAISFAAQTSTLIFLSFCERKGYYRRFRKNLSLLSNSISVLILIILIFLSGLAASLSVSTEHSNIKMLYIQVFTVILVVLSLITIIVLLINSISKKHYEQTAELLEEKMQSQLKYYIMLDEKDTEMKKFRHDFRKHMLCVISMLEEESFSDAENYIRGLTNKFNEAVPLYKTGNYIADSILSDKAQECKDKGISFKFTGVIPEKDLNPLELCTILSNSLENAIEACIKVSESSPQIRIASD